MTTENKTNEEIIMEVRRKLHIVGVIRKNSPERKYHDELISLAKEAGYKQRQLEVQQTSKLCAYSEESNCNKEAEVCFECLKYRENEVREAGRQETLSELDKTPCNPNFKLHAEQNLKLKDCQKQISSLKKELKRESTSANDYYLKYKELKSELSEIEKELEELYNNLSTEFNKIDESQICITPLSSQYYLLLKEYTEIIKKLANRIEKLMKSDNK